MDALASVMIGGASLAAGRLSGVNLRLVGLLDDAERSLAAAILSSAQRDRFLAGRILLRLHAAGLAGAAPDSLRVDYHCPACAGRGNNVHGAPGYKLPPQACPVRLSLSRSGDWCLIAGSPKVDVIGVGVDVQDMASTDFDGFEAVALTSVERNLLRRVTPSQRAAFKTRLWVRKEAVLKALGSGLAVDPSTIDVSGPAPLVRGRPLNEEQWLIEDVSPVSVGLPDNFVAALALLSVTAGAKE